MHHPPARFDAVADEPKRNGDAFAPAVLTEVDAELAAG